MSGSIKDLAVIVRYRGAGVQSPRQRAANRADEIRRRAHQSWEAGQLRSAFRLMLSAAKLGDSAGMVNTGYFYDLGIGVRKNRDSAVAWSKRAYSQGDAAGANNVATIYSSEGKPRRALLWFEKARAAGDIDANLEIARLYLDDIEDADKAVPYLEPVLAARPGVDVTRNSREEARLLLKGLSPTRRSRAK